MIRAEITRKPPSWEKNLFQSEPDSYVPPHLFMLARTCFVGLNFFSGNETRKCPSAFVYVSRYISKHNERVCRLERLGFSTSNKKEQMEIIENIPQIAIQIFGSLDVLEVEVFSKVNSRIFFPSTLHFLGSCNRLELLDLYYEAGFKRVQTKHCYEIGLDATWDKSLQSDSKLALRPIKREEWRTYWELWGQSDYCSDTSYPFKGLTNAMFSDFVPFISDPPYMVIYHSRLGFLFKTGLKEIPSPLGFIQWVPNIYGLASLDERYSLSGCEKELSEIREAKIFKLILNPKLKTSSYNSVLYLALSTLKAKGVEKCQIGNFKEDDPLIALLKERSIGKHVNTTEILHKKI